MRKLLGKTRTCRQDRKLMYGNVRGQAGKGRLRQRIRQKNVQVEEQRGKKIGKLVGKKQEKKIDLQKIMQKELGYSKIYGNESGQVK